jgi:enoyl-CoA hydratase/carnithine racemase
MSITTSTVNGVARIGFDRPAKKNALTADMYAALAQAVVEAEHDEAVVALLFHGQHDLFTAGNDLEDFLGNPPGPDASVFAFMRELAAASKPVVAAVNGPAVGIGTTMLLHCDLVYLADDATLVLPFVKLGLCPEFASSLLLPALAGHARAAEKLLLAEPITPAEALSMGLATRVLPAAQVFAFACSQAERFNALSGAAVIATKRLMKQARQAQVSGQMQAEVSAFGALLAGPDAQAAMLAFLERRNA